MSELNAAPDGAAPPPAAVDAVAPGSTPGQAPVDAGGESNDAAYWKGEAKKAFVKRDNVLAEFQQSEQFQTLQAKAQLAEQLEQERASAERKAAEERGEFKQLYEQRTAEIDRIKAEAAAQLASKDQAFQELASKHRHERARAALSEAYAAAGGIDLEAFLVLAADRIGDGSIAVADDGAVQGHGAVVAEFIQKRGYLFRQGGQAAIEHLKAHGVNVQTGPAAFENRDQDRTKIAEQTGQTWVNTLAGQTLSRRPAHMQGQWAERLKNEPSG